MTATSPFHLDGDQPFSHRDGVLHVGGLPVDQLAGAASTPLYLYDLDAVASAYRRLEAAFRPGQALLSRQRETWGDLLAWESRPARRLPVAVPPTRQPVGSRP
jgi:hypothetical protein